MLYTNASWIVEGITLKALIDRDVRKARVHIPISSILLEIDKKLIKNYEKVEEIYKAAYTKDESYEEEFEGCRIFLFEEKLILLAKQDVEKLSKIIL